MDEDLLIGKRVGKYRIDRVLGRGGMGVVYLATHVEIGQKVAVKTLAAHLSQHAQYRERFLREAKACSAMRHPGLVQIFDYGALEDGTLYILMELLEGESLRDRLDKEPKHGLEALSALHIAQQLAAAMALAHEHGIVHRDLKPDNILLVSDSAAPLGERPKILDFGIAKFVGISAPPTIETQGLLGTPTYMAPERCTGEGVIDGQSDVYALGCMLYEMLCGRPPFVEDPRSLMMMHVASDPRPLRERRDDISEPVDSLVRRMLAKPPADRPTMLEVASAIQSLLGIPTPRSRPALLRGLRRRRNLFGIAGLGVLLFCGAIAWWWPKEKEMVQIPSGVVGIGSTAEELARDIAWIGELKYEKTYRLISEPPYGLLDREHLRPPISLQSFFFDIHEVTNADFVKFLNHLRQEDAIGIDNREDGEKKNADWVFLGKTKLYNLHEDPRYNGISVSAKDGSFSLRKGMAQKPVVAVTWDAAKRYCNWLNKRLPSEAEWEYVARNLEKRTRFPWGPLPPNCKQTVIERDETTPYKHCAAITPPLPDVGSNFRDRTFLGVLDMGGSVSEWVEDSFLLPDAECEAGYRVVRGGSWQTDFATARSTNRIKACATRTDPDTGFRCARSFP